MAIQFPEEIDLTYEGIATWHKALRYVLLYDLEEIDLTYEGIATTLSSSSIMQQHPL